MAEHWYCVYDRLDRQVGHICTRSKEELDRRKKEYPDREFVRCLTTERAAEDLGNLSDAEVDDLRGEKDG